MSDEQDQAEALDEEEIDGPFPPDEPLGADDTQEPDSFAGRSVREEPDRLIAERPVVRPFAEDDLLDDESQLIADAAEGAPDPEADGQPPSAEEAAMHLDDE
jgi:hypothetical protein